MARSGSLSDFERRLVAQRGMTTGWTGNSADRTRNGKGQASRNKWRPGSGKPKKRPAALQEQVKILEEVRRVSCRGLR